MSTGIPAGAATALLLTCMPGFAAEPPAPSKRSPAPFIYAWATAYHIPPETTTEESGYFSLCEGNDGKIYVGAAAYGRNAYLLIRR
jgi:hypothetical protein